MNVNFSKTVLLTGAGFTANFGGFLAWEMWSKIFNNPKLDTLTYTKAALKDNFDFEAIYYEVMTSGKYINERSGFQEVLIEGYADMDAMLKQVRNTLNMHGVRDLLSKFEGSSGEVGVCFTLNQDVFLERYMSWQPFGPQTIHYPSSSGYIRPQDVDTNKQIVLPTQAEISKFEQEFNATEGRAYMKLHGSHGWVSADGERQMVLGLNKLEAIEKEPQLLFYLNRFKEIINRSGVKVLVIGYSFRDQHINNCLLDAIEQSKIKLYIVSPEKPQKLKDRIYGKPEDPRAMIWSQDEPRKQKIWDSIDGYFPYTLSDVYPADQSGTHIRTDIFRALNLQ